MIENKLSPLPLESLSILSPWGSEQYLLADLGYIDTRVRSGMLEDSTLSEIMETYMDAVVGDNVYYYFGRQFPVMMKRITTSDTPSPLLVCPPDSVSIPRYDALGKKKFWYVISAVENAHVGIGFSRDISAEEFYTRCQGGDFEGLLNLYPAKAGSTFVVDPCVVHFIGEGIDLVEISPSSALDFHLSTWDDKIEEDSFVQEGFGPVEALDFIQLSAHTFRLPNTRDEAGDLSQSLSQEEEFIVKAVNLSDPVRVYSEEYDSFLAYYCVSGEASLQMGGDSYILREGDTILVCALSDDFLLLPRKRGTFILEASIDRTVSPDSYLGSENLGLEGMDGDSEEMDVEDDGEEDDPYQEGRDF